MADDTDRPLAKARRKLVESKERWAREGRLLTGRAARPAEERLPPGQRQVTNWPVLDLGIQPNVPAEHWQLTIDGLVENPVTWDKHILATVRPKPEARFVVFHSYDDYTTNLPLAEFDAEDVLLAHSWQGRPLPREHGGPVRAIVPRLYFWKSAKWIRRIEFLAADRSGFWEERGYHDHGDPWTEERYG